MMHFIFPPLILPSPGDVIRAYHGQAPDAVIRHYIEQSNTSDKKGRRSLAGRSVCSQPEPNVFRRAEAASRR